MPAAVIGAGISAVGSVAGGVASGKGAAKAAAIQREAAREQMQFAQGMYDKNVAQWTPDINYGNRASDQIAALLGLGGDTGYSTPPITSAPTTATPTTGSAVSKIVEPGKQVGMMSSVVRIADNMPAGKRAAALANNPQLREAYDRVHMTTAPTTTLPTTTPKTAAGAQQDAFQRWRDSTGYQFALNQGLGAINSNAYAAGAGNSGATLKALQDRGTEVGNQYFGNYLSQLGGVQAVGSTAKSSLANQGQNLVNSQANSSQNAANAASWNANQQASAWGNTLSSLAKIGGGLINNSSNSSTSASSYDPVRDGA